MKPSKVIHTVKRGSLEIRVKQYADGRYGFDLKPDDAIREKVRCTNLDDAIQRADQLLGKGQAGRLNLLSISPEELTDFLRYREAQQNRCPALKKLVAAFLAEKKKLHDKRELSHAHFKDLNGTLTKFSAHFVEVERIDQLDRKAVEEWLNQQNIGPRSFNNRRSHLVAVARYARGHRWIGRDTIPLEEIPKRKADVIVGTFTPEEMKRLLLHVPEEWRPAIVLGGFCGIRPEELCPDPNSHKPPLRWENFLWHKRKIDMPASVSKDGRRRFVPLGEAALAWLAPYRDAKGRTVPNKRLDNQPRVWEKKASLDWKKDGLRHSYASYRLALTQDIAALSEEMGNSPRMIRKHYLDLKHEDEATEWFGLTPDRLGIETLPRNVVQFG
jgi:integrase